MKLLEKTIIALVLLSTGWLASMAQVPDKPKNASPIVDLAGVINNDSLSTALNAQLDTLSHRTKYQMVVVTIADMGGMDAKEFATELGNKWGVGGKNLDNGLVVVVKPKNENGSGQVGFATGYALEGNFPDTYCKRLQEEFMLPHFKDNDYAGGIKAAIDEIVPKLQEDYKETQAATGGAKAKKKGGGSGTGWFILAGIAALIGLLMMMRKRSKPAASAQSPAQPAQQAVSQPQEEEPKEKTAKANAQAAGAVAGATLASAAKKPAPKQAPAKKEEEPYKYNYGGGSFGGGGASSSW